MHAIWIEIPVEDLDRAQRFYASVFAHEPVDVLEGDGRAIAVLEGTPTVSLNRTDGFTPTRDGALPYFHVDGPAADVVARISAAGGEILEPPAPRADHGVFTMLADSEGNALYVHTGS